MIDAHCHINDKKFAGREEKIINEAEQAGVTKIICVGCNYESSKKAIELASTFDGVFATVGIHPEEAGLITNLVKNDKVVAIGETGLDFKYEDRERQKELFKYQVELAKKNNLPLIVHNRDADGEILEIVGDYERVMMHCFTGDMNFIRECVARGWYISFGGIITFKNSGGLREVVKETPEKNILIETDAPYLAPEPFRGSVNTPANVRIVAQAVADARGVSLGEIDRLTTKNTQRLFGI